MITIISTKRVYKTRHDWTGKKIHWVMGKEFRFDHTNKWYKHNPEFALENETLAILRDFVIQTYHQVPGRKSNLGIILQKKQHVPNIHADHRKTIKESEKREKNREPQKLWNIKVTVISLIIGALGAIAKGLVK